MKITRAAAAKVNRQVLRMGSTTGLHQGRVTAPVTAALAAVGARIGG